MDLQQPAKSAVLFFEPDRLLLRRVKWKRVGIVLAHGVLPVALRDYRFQAFANLGKYQRQIR